MQQVELKYDIDKEKYTDYNNDVCAKCEEIVARGGIKPVRPKDTKMWESIEFHGTLRKEQVRALR